MPEPEHGAQVYLCGITVAAVDAMSKLATPAGFMRTYPAPAVCDGHFCAVLRKKRA